MFPGRGLGRQSEDENNSLAPLLTLPGAQAVFPRSLGIQLQVSRV